MNKPILERRKWEEKKQVGAEYEWWHPIRPVWCFIDAHLFVKNIRLAFFSAILSFRAKTWKPYQTTINLNLQDIKPEVRIHLKVSLTLKAFSRCSAGFWYKLRIMVFEGHFATMLSLKVLQMKHCKSNAWGQLEGWTSFNNTSNFIAF